jgi:hypothetical protein
MINDPLLPKIPNARPTTENVGPTTDVDEQLVTFLFPDIFHVVL